MPEQPLREDGWQQRLSLTITSLCQQPPSPTPSRSWNCLGTGSSTSTPVISVKKSDTRKPVEVYGELHGRVGEGSNGTVMIYKRDTSLYAVKRFRKPKRNETSKGYMKRLTSEYCIASSVSAHPNVITTIDLVLKEGRYCTVMEYSSGGDLFACLKNNVMTTDYERDCCFKQLIRGIAHLHSLGVAHRDIKPENLLWTRTGKLKICDFGSARVFRTPYDKVAVLPWERDSHKVGSLPYIAPEKSNARPDAADIWSAGIVLYCLYRNGLPWKQAHRSDPGFNEFSRCQGNFVLFSVIPAAPRNLMYRMLDINPQSRASADEILSADPWCKSIMVCRDEIDFANRTHCHASTNIF